MLCINVYTEKNKLAPSQYSVPVVFDKKFGIHPLWSEYWFLLNKTKTEKKLYPKDNKMPYPLLITGTPTKRVLEVINPNDFSSMYRADFKEKDFIEKYHTDATFKQWFDYAVDVSVFKRIKEGLFKITGISGQNAVNEDEVIEDIQNKIPDGVTQHTDPETGEVTYMDENGNIVDLGQQFNVSSVG